MIHQRNTSLATQLAKMLMVALFGSICLSSSAFADLFLVQVGLDGSSTALSNAATAAVVKRFNDDTSSLLSTINLPTTASGANKQLTLSGTATTEGFLAVSTNGQYLTLGGYGADVGTSAVPTQMSSVVNRVLGRIEISSGQVDTSTALTDAYDTVGGSGNNGTIRSVVTTDGTQFWAAGSNSGVATNGSAGVRYAALGDTTSTQLSSSPTNTRAVKIVDSQLYVTTASGSFIGVNTVGPPGPPTTDGQTTTLLPGFPGSEVTTPDPYDFWFKDANTLYIADQRSQANGGGLKKWVLSEGTWALDSTFQSGLTTGLRNLTGTVDGNGDAVLYAVTNNSPTRLVKLTDTGASSAFTTLLTAATNTSYRGLAYFASSSVGLPGDFNNNGFVDAGDYVTWRKNEVANVSLPNDNGLTDQAARYSLWRANFGNPPGAGSGDGLDGANVPEPASAVLLVIGLAALCSRRSRG